MKFCNHIVVLGCGSVAKCTIPLIIKHLEITPHQLTVIDFEDHRDTIPEEISYVLQKITKDNYETILSSHLKTGDLLIDLAWNISTIDLLIWCRKNGVLFVNTSVEHWNPYSLTSEEERTLYQAQMNLRNTIKAWNEEGNPTAVLDHGANPGLISSFVKQGIIDIARRIDRKTPSGAKKDELKANLSLHNFPELARIIGLKTIHVSELDTQVTNFHRRPNEFVNTWSVEGFYEEGTAPAELGWGTHENELPPGAHKHSKGPKNQIYLDSKGMETWVESWVPSGPINAMVIRHGEAFSLSESLACKAHGRVIYRPTVHYAYRPSLEALQSVKELISQNYAKPKHQRVMSDEIISGKDELGALLLGHELGAWWTGSILDIEESRRLVPHQSATTVQVAIGVVAAVLYCIENPAKGICLPDHLPHDFVLEIAKPYLGKFVSMQSNWRPSKQKQNKNDWRFEVFSVSVEEAAIR